MSQGTSTENIFRYMSMRAPKPFDKNTGILLQDDSPFLKELKKIDNDKDLKLFANKWLQDHLQKAETLLGEKSIVKILNVLKKGHQEQWKISKLIEGLKESTSDSFAGRFDQILNFSSDLVLAFKVSGSLSHQFFPEFMLLFKGLTLVEKNNDLNNYENLPAHFYLDKPISLKKISDSKKTKPVLISHKPSPAVTAEKSAENLANAFEELLFLYRSGWVSKSTGLWNADFKKQLSARSRQTLDSLSLDFTKTQAAKILSDLESELGRYALLLPFNSVLGWPESQPVVPDENPNSMPKPTFKASGVGDLLVVKQHLLSYNRMDIAHVENVLAGEKKSRNHRYLERTEDISATEKEVIRETQKELESTDRYEMRREMERTASQDLEMGFGLSLSGKYGPTIDFSSNFDLQSTTHNEEQVKNSTGYAKEVMSRSIDRVVERVREERIRKIVRESEETNLHELKNEGSSPITGVYQFLEKTYSCQVFNYGVRQLFDVMIPNPSSYLWMLENAPSAQVEIPGPPPPLESIAANANAINPFNYLRLGALYNVEGLTPPPSLFKSVALSLKSGEGGDESGRPRTVLTAEIDIPQGYRPYSADLRPMALTDDDLTLAMTVGGSRTVWKPRNVQTGLHDLQGLDLGAGDLRLNLFDDTLTYEEQTKLPVMIVSYETNTFSIGVTASFMRTEVAYMTWKIKTYDAIAAGYRSAQLKYDQKVEDLKARAEAKTEREQRDFGTSPSENEKIIRAELKKNCLTAILDPWLNLNTMQLDGSSIRFFEQAFEWDQLQYVFYPYFWSDQNYWKQKFLRKEIDPQFQEFLKAGSARVVLSVRPGFEAAVNYFLETGEIWNGAGSPPLITSPEYVSIITEIQERTGADSGEVEVGEPWLSHIPTSVVIARTNPELPTWERVGDSGWNWNEVNV